MCCKVTLAHSLHFWAPQLLAALPSSCGIAMRKYRCKGPGLCWAHEDTPKSELLCFLSLGDQRGQAWQVNCLLPWGQPQIPSIVVVSKTWAIWGETGHPNLPVEGSPLPCAPCSPPVNWLHLLDLTEDQGLEPWEWGCPLTKRVEPGPQGDTL